MARPHIRCADRITKPLREHDAHGARHFVPENFDSSKHGEEKQKFAREFAHRQIRATQFNAMVTGFAATLALQRCTQQRLDNKPAPQAVQ